MKHIQLTVLAICMVLSVNAQNKIKAYEYWFDNDFAHKIVTAVTPVKQISLNANVSTSNLANGIHTITIRTLDDSARYSSTVSKFFYKMPENITTNQNIVAYQYWFNNDFANAVTVNNAIEQQVSINELFTTQNLPQGIHTVHIRVKDNAQQWSSALSKFFYKMTENTTTTHNMVAYQYWFNNDFANAVTVSNAIEQQVSINELFTTQNLPQGIHTVHIRVKDNAQQWSSALSKFFFKMPENSTTTQNIVAYQYWFNNDFANAVTVNNAIEQQVSINELLTTQNLPQGIHTVHIRVKDNAQQWSSALSKFFYKMPENITTTQNIVAYQYWFNNDFANAVTVNNAIEQQVSINELFTTQNLPQGIHTVHIRVKDNAQQWSSALSKFFYKLPTQTANNSITNYRYWLNSDFDNAVTVSIEGNVSQLSLVDNIDFTKIPKGIHVISFQFKDAFGMWSSIIADSVTKNSLPISNFSHTSNPQCALTSINFTNMSIDADSYLWDFGDGTTDSIANPSHTYYTPGKYDIRLNITDTVTLAQTFKQIEVFVTGNTSNAFAIASCDSYASPSGKYFYTTSGIYNDTIANQWGCDSLLTINATITKTPQINVSQNGSTLTAIEPGLNYKWLDCNTNFTPIIGEIGQSFTALNNGSYAVEISDNNCVDTSICYSVVYTVISKNLKDKITYYPNPTNGKLTIELGDTYPETIIRIYNLSGELLHSSLYENKNILELNIDNTSGTYIIDLNTGKEKALFKIIKK